MRKQKRKPRLALFSLGILGGSFGQGIPVLSGLFQQLSNDFDIVLYCFQSIDKKQIPSTISVRQVVQGALPGRMKYVLLAFRFLIDHFFRSYELIMAVSIFPAGKWAVSMGRLTSLPVVLQLIDHEAVDLPSDIMHVNRGLVWFRKLTDEVCKNAAVVIALSEYQKENILRSLNCTPEIIVLPLRINTTNFSYKDRPLSFPVQFIHVGYYSRIKDQNTLFKTFAIFSQRIDSRLFVIGDGFDVPEVHNLINELGIADKVSFAGFVKNAELSGYFDRAHILLHTSRFEAEPVVMQEAMVHSVLVCGTAVGTLADIGDRYGILAPPGNALLMAERMLEVVQDPDAYRKITGEAYRWISIYNSMWSYLNYRNVLKKLIGNSDY